MSNSRIPEVRYKRDMEDLPTLRQLSYFVTLAEEQHFGRAAERSGIAQPPLTQQIQRLERQLGCQLLIRGRRTQLTAAGAALAPDARRLLRQAEQIVENARRIARGETGQLRIGVPPSVMLTRLPEAIRRYRHLYPSVDFTLRELATSAIEQALRAGEIDLGFLRETQPEPPLQFSLFLSEPLVAILPVKHTLARTRNVALKRLHSDPFVFFPKRLGPAFHDRLIQACIDAGFTPNIAQEATQWQTVVSFVEAGMGVSIAPQSVSKFRVAGIVYRPLVRLQTSVYASWREQALAPAAEIFLKLAAARLENPSLKR
jgi:DNA-binding transcriptional LysR family regulator